jgi:hypothetical protein
LALRASWLLLKLLELDGKDVADIGQRLLLNKGAHRDFKSTGEIVNLLKGGDLLLNTVFVDELLP